MFKYQAGFIGAGNMGGALLSAVAKETKTLAVYDKDKAKAAAADAEVVAPDVLAANSRFVFLGVKPNVLPAVAKQIAPSLQPETIVVSMAAGVSAAEVCRYTGTNNVIRIMPNTPVAVGAGMTLYAPASGITRREETEFLALMAPTGKLDRLDEKLMDAGMALSGCGPAYVYMFCEALADGAVRCGLPRDKAMQYAVQTVLGSAEMLEESGRHPGELKDAVCSPGGTTIEGVLALENAGFRGAAASAVTAAFDKLHG